MRESHSVDKCFRPAASCHFKSSRQLRPGSQNSLAPTTYPPPCPGLTLFFPLRRTSSSHSLLVLFCASIDNPALSPPCAGPAENLGCRYVRTATSHRSISSCMCLSRLLTDARVTPELSKSLFHADSALCMLPCCTFESRLALAMAPSLGHAPQSNYPDGVVTCCKCHIIPSRAPHHFSLTLLINIDCLALGSLYSFFDELITRLSNPSAVCFYSVFLFSFPRSVYATNKVLNFLRPIRWL